MDLSNDAPQAEIAVESAAEAVNEQSPTVITAESRLSLDPNTRDALLFGEETPASAAGVEPEPAKEPEIATETEPEAKSDDEPEATVEDEPEKILPNRISTKQFDSREQEAIALRHDLANQGEKISLLEACQRVEAKYAGVTPAADATIPELDTDAGPTEIETLEQEAKALAERLAEFDDGLVNAEFRRLQSEHAEKLADIKVAKLEAKLASQKQAETAQTQAEKARAERMTAREANKAEVLKEYPTAADAKSPLGKELTLLFNEVNGDPNHPYRAEMAKDTFPAFLTQKAVESKTAELKSLGFTAEQATAIIKGQPLETAKPAKAEQPKQTTVPRTVLVTQAGPKAAPSPKPALTPAEAIAKARANPSFRDEILGFGNGMVIR